MNAPSSARATSDFHATNTGIRLTRLALWASQRLVR